MTKRKPLHILILGASGFVGGRLARRLIQKGYTVMCAVRDIQKTKLLFPKAAVIQCDFIKDTDSSIWADRLKGIDVIINCVGIFYHPDKKKIWASHYETPKALFEAAERSKVKKIVHLSALGVEHYPTTYAQSKWAAEQCLKACTVPHVILRPSFIYGPGSRGGMSLIRALSALPFLMPIPGQGKQRFQPIYVDDLVSAIEQLLSTSETQTLAAVSLKPITLKEIMQGLRQWLGFNKAWMLPIPMAFIRFFARLGNMMPNSSMNSEAMAMLNSDNITTRAESLKFQRAADTVPRSFNEGLLAMPAVEADRWYARLFLMQPLLRISLSLMWLFGGITSIFFSHAVSYALLQQVGISPAWQPLFLYGAAGLNIFIAIALLLNIKTTVMCIFQVLLILVYTTIITFQLPHLWLEPFGPVVKNIPILVGILFLYMMESS